MKWGMALLNLVLVLHPVTRNPVHWMKASAISGAHVQKHTFRRVSQPGKWVKTYFPVRDTTVFGICKTRKALPLTTDKIPILTRVTIGMPAMIHPLTPPFYRIGFTWSARVEVAVMTSQIVTRLPE